MYRKAVANMIHELADGAQFITTTFRFGIDLTINLIIHFDSVQAGAAGTRQQVLWGQVQEQSLPRGLCHQGGSLRFCG